MCLKRKKKSIFFSFFTAEDADSSEVIDHRLIRGIARKQLAASAVGL